VEVDHRVILERGGANTLSNFWPQHHPQAKDRLENRLTRRCAPAESGCAARCAASSPIGAATS